MIKWVCQPIHTILAHFGICAYSKKNTFWEIIEKCRCAYIVYITVNFRCIYIRVEVHIHFKDACATKHANMVPSQTSGEEWSDLLQSLGWQPILFVAWCQLWWFASLEKSMAMYDTECPCLDHVLLKTHKLTLFVSYVSDVQHRSSGSWLCCYCNSIPMWTEGKLWDAGCGWTRQQGTM